MASNQASWAASERWVQPHDLPISQRDYHSLHWLLYSLLEQGRYHRRSSAARADATEPPRLPVEEPFMRLYGAFLHASMAAAFVMDTARWDQATAVTAPLPAPAANATAPPSSAGNSYQALTALAQTPALFARGLAAAVQGAPEAQQSLAELRTIQRSSRTKRYLGCPWARSWRCKHWRSPRRRVLRRQPRYRHYHHAERCHAGGNHAAPGATAGD